MKNTGNEKLGQIEKLYRQYASLLTFYTRKFVDNDTAKDIIQDLFLKLCTVSDEILFGEDIKSYLYQSVRNACIDYLKRQETENNYIQTAINNLKLEEIYFNDDSQFVFSADERLKSVYKTVLTLPEQCRRIFTMYYFEEQKSSDIATKLDLSVRTVESQLYKALKLLRKTLVPALIILLLSL